MPPLTITGLRTLVANYGTYKSGSKAAAWLVMNNGLKAANGFKRTLHTRLLDQLITALLL
jgi:hypothetical protein